MRAYSQLADLEVLLISIPDQNIRTYAGEAIASYSAGAYRSAIVSIWIAVVFDLYHKFRYLDEQYGDAAAHKCIENIDKIRSSNDKKQISAWERNILKDAFQNVKMLTETEYEHLDRIQKDRHRCAHPVLDQDGFLFQPSPELARAHIRTAIEVLLSQPIIVGKAAIDALVRDVEYGNYPNDPESIKRALEGRHLPMSAKYRTNLFIFSLKKSLYLEPDDYQIINRYVYIFYNLHNEYRSDFETIDKNKLSDIFIRAQEERYNYLAALLYLEGSLWESIPGFVQEKFKVYIKESEGISLKLYTIHILPEVKDEILSDYFSERYDSAPKFLKRISDLSERIRTRNPDFIKEILKFNIGKLTGSFFPKEAKDYGDNLISPAIELMEEDDIEFLLKSFIEHQEENPLKEKLDNLIPLMMEIYTKTIRKFPENILTWQEFYKSREGIWDGIEELGSLIEAYPDHEDVIQLTVSKEAII